MLVGCTDGVGTKLLVAIAAGRCDTVGIDLVAMNVNDLICTGAEPLFFLDYIGTGKLAPPRMAEIVKGVADGCMRAGCALLGGETAEMPDIYRGDDFDLAGFAVGVVERRRIIDGRRVEVGDTVIALASDGLHSNGYRPGAAGAAGQGRLPPGRPPRGAGGADRRPGAAAADADLRQERC